MVTMLDVIKRSKEKLELIIKDRKEIFRNVIEFVKDKEINEIVFIGSGSSYSSIMSSMLFVDKVSGIQTFGMLPNLFINKASYNKNALYVFVSQTGTSSLTLAAANKVRDLGYTTLALCGDENSPIAKACEYFALIACGYEEYTYATLGFTCSILTEMLLGLEIGLFNKTITNEEYDKYIEELNKVPSSNANTIDKTLAWFEKEKENLLKSENFILFGGVSLFGIANEGALKIMEITKKYISLGYEMDDGLHGPNYCFDQRTIVLALNDGKDNDKAIALMNLMKKEYGTGYMIGLNPMEDKDLPLDFQTINFTNLEIISFVQTLAYKLADEIKVDIFQRSDPRLNTTKGKGYFNMHDVTNK